jgi:hypothetical protein
MLSSPIPVSLLRTVVTATEGSCPACVLFPSVRGVLLSLVELVQPSTGLDPHLGRHHVPQIHAVESSNIQSFPFTFFRFYTIKPWRYAPVYDLTAGTIYEVQARQSISRISRGYCTTVCTCRVQAQSSRWLTGQYHHRQMVDEEFPIHSPA